MTKCAATPDFQTAYADFENNLQSAQSTAKNSLQRLNNGFKFQTSGTALRYTVNTNKQCALVQKVEQNGNVGNLYVLCFRSQKVLK